MNNEVRKELEKAKKFYKNKQYCEALDIFEKNLLIQKNLILLQSQLGNRGVAQLA